MRAASEPIGDEYDVVSLRASWGALSLVSFLFALVARYVSRYLPWQPSEPWMYPLLWVLLTFAFGLVGLLAGLLGLRYGRHPGAARLGLLLNAVVVGCVLLIVAAMFYIRYGR